MKLFWEVDRRSVRFQMKSKIKCSAGCGQCCESPQVEVTVLEMLPLALDLYHRQDADQWLAKAREREFSGPCVFYKPDPLFAGKGRCLAYALRPLLCRLFGFSTKRDKYSRPVYVTCKIIKAGLSAQVRHVQGSPAFLKTLPFMGDYAAKVYNIDPSLGARLYPINEALRIALDKVSLYFQYYGKNTLPPSR